MPNQAMETATKEDFFLSLFTTSQSKSIKNFFFKTSMHLYEWKEDVYIGQNRSIA
jgi:hypothetical protein